MTRSIVHTLSLAALAIAVAVVMAMPLAAQPETSHPETPSPETPSPGTPSPGTSSPEDTRPLPVPAESPQPPLTAGPYFACGPSFHLGAPAGEEGGSLFAFRLGASIQFPLEGTLAGTLQIGSDSRGIERRPAGVLTSHTITRVGYLSFTPGFAIGPFRLGINFGIPLAATRTETVGGTHRVTTLRGDEFAGLEYMIEPRAGAVVRIFEDARGWLGATLDAGVTFNQIALGPAALPDQAADDRGDYRIFSSHIGLTYHFILPSP